MTWWVGVAGIQEMMELMRGMPASISASPLREQQRAGHNLPSAALKGLVRQPSGNNVLSISVTLAGERWLFSRGVRMLRGACAGQQ